MIRLSLVQQSNHPYAPVQENRVRAEKEITMSLMSLTAVELGKKIKAKEVTVVEAVQEALDAVEKIEKDVNSFVTVMRKEALEKAKEVQEKIDNGELTGPLAGVPVAIKDNMCTKGTLTTCSSKILRNFVPTYTAQEPPEDPPGTCSVFHGFFVGPNAEVSVVLPMANSSIFVLPMITAPAENLYAYDENVNI